MKTFLLSFLLVFPLVAQQTPSEFITANFTWQSSQLGDLQLYAANVCNAGPVTATAQAYRDVWPRAAEKGLSLQTPTAIREAEDKATGKPAKAWVTYIIGGACAVASGVTNSGVVSLNKDKGVGKFIAYGSSACAIALPIWASTMSKVPGGDREVPYDQLLPAVFVLGPGDCKQYLVYTASPSDQKALPSLWRAFDIAAEKK
jgi:hypothetical protein